MFITIAGSGARYINFLIFEVISAAMRVAREPNIISQMAQPVKILEITQPINKPGIADGKKTGKILSASDSLHCIEPLSSPSVIEI